MIIDQNDLTGTPTAAGDVLAILRHGHNRLAKTWLANGRIGQYGDAKFFTLTETPVSGLHALSALLVALQDDPRACVIRGRYAGNAQARLRDAEHRPGYVRRTLDCFDDQPLHAIMLDIDKFQPLATDADTEPEAAIAEFVETMLPGPFQRAGYHWQLSGSAGHPSKRDGLLRAHIWFWLSTPRTSVELKAWAKAEGVAVDTALFNPVQVHYTAGPVMAPGVTDTIARRWGLVDGGAVELDINTPVVAQGKAGRVSGGRGQRLLDAAATNETVQRLFELGKVLDRSRDGFFIECPCADGHTPGSGGPTSTEYRLPHTGGHAKDHIICKHDSCLHRTREDFLRAIGIDELADEMAVTVVDNETGELVEIASPTFSDDRLALDLAEQVASQLRYTPGMGWMEARDTHWCRDEHLRRYVLARALCREAAATADKAPERKALASSRTVSAVLTLAQSDRRLMVPAAAWDADPFALNTPAGVVDLQSGGLRPRAGDLVTKCTRVAPDFDGECPNWLRFLDAVCAGDAELVEFLQRLLGYMLTGDRREQKLFFIWGKGANGKTTLGELLLWLLGQYGLKLPSSVLMQSAHDRHPTELAQLQSVRAAVSSELEEGQFFNEARVKELTGDDTLSARFMRGDFFGFAMTHKHLVIGNHKPRLKGGDPAMARRLVLIPFKAAFTGAEADQEMPAKLRAEGGAILAWMIRGAVAWHRGGLVVPAVVRTASDEYLADHNDVELWIEERCERQPGAKGKARELYSDFSLWKQARGERAPSAVTWAERMSLVPGVQKVRSNGAHYTTVRLRAESNACEFA